MRSPKSRRSGCILRSLSLWNGTRPCRPVSWRVIMFPAWITSHANRQLPVGIMAPIFASHALRNVRTCASIVWMCLSVAPLLCELPAGLCSCIVCVSDPLCYLTLRITELSASSWSVLITTLWYPRTSRMFKCSRTDHSSILYRSTFGALGSLCTPWTLNRVPPGP